MRDRHDPGKRCAWTDRRCDLTEAASRGPRPGFRNPGQEERSMNRQKSTQTPASATAARSRPGTPHRGEEPRASAGAVAPQKAAAAPQATEPQTATVAPQ